MHGALHLFLKGSSLQKCCWKRTGVPLKQQIESALAQRKYPLIVAAGTAEDKLARIQRSSYLGHGLRSLSNITGALFVYGLSMGEKDNHILDVISSNFSIKALFIGLYGDISSPHNKMLIEKANQIAQKRLRTKSKNQNILEVAFFDSTSAQIWTATGKAT